MCAFCENSKIISEDYTEYSYQHIKRIAILGNYRRMSIKFEEINPLKHLKEMEKIKISFCPICGQELRKRRIKNV